MDEEIVKTPVVETPVVETPIEPLKKVDESVDETGVPWKNRAMDERRKREEIERMQEERIASETEEERLAEEEKLYNIDRSVITAAKKIAREEASVLEEKINHKLENERIVVRQVSNVLNSLEKDTPELHKYRAQIEQELDTIPAESRGHPFLIRKFAYAIAGEDELKNRKKVTPVKQVSPINASSMGIGGNNKSITLTSEEEAFGDEKDLWSKGFTEKEVREMYKEREEKLRKLEGK